MTDHDDDLPGVADVEVAEVGRGAREHEVEGQQDEADGGRDADRPLRELRQRRAREQGAERERAEDVVQPGLVRRERGSGGTR